MLTINPSQTKKHRSETKRISSPALPPVSEIPVWQSFPSEWRQLYGSYYDLGISVEWHDFEVGANFEWSRSFHPGSIELCLNLEGRGLVDDGAQHLAMEPMTVGFYAPGNQALRAWRYPGQRHRFITVEFSTPFLRAQLAGCDGSLQTLVEQVVQGRAGAAGISQAQQLSTATHLSISHLLQPPVFQGARTLWYQSKVLELMAEFFFQRQEQDELFCDRQKRLARERVDKVIAHLRANLAEPLNLEQLGRKVGCSPYYLSRTFSAEMNVTIIQFLRKLRIERAAELLRSGKYNVTETALEVGYSSLSHFSQAFCQTMGCCPALYPFQKSAAKAPED